MRHRKKIFMYNKQLLNPTLTTSKKCPVLQKKNFLHTDYLSALQTDIRETIYIAYFTQRAMLILADGP